MPVMEDEAEIVFEAVRCRRQQIDLLLSFFGQKEHIAPASLFLYGHTGTGKSMVVNSIMSLKELPHVLVNCVECHTQRLMFEHILNELSGVQPAPDNEFSAYARCANFNDFVRMFKLAYAEKKIEETFYIILDKVERLRDMEMNLLPAFLRLQELTGLNVTVLLLSEIVWEKYRTGTCFREPLPIHFPDYSKDELLEIIEDDCPSPYPVEFYTQYCNLLLSVFHTVCRNLNELRHLALLNFPKYVEPVESGEATIQNSAKLWRNIQPHLSKALQTVYLREISSAQWEKMQQEAIDAGSAVSLPTGASYRGNVELPFYSKYLLIAAYLASYNPAKTDRRFFTKGSSKTSKRSNLASMKKHERTSNQLLGPKPFPLDRLMAIFYSIVEGRVAATANIFSQIQSLVTLGMLAQIASADQLDAPKYKCLVSLELIKSVSRHVNFEVVRYLYDFV